MLMACLRASGWASMYPDDAETLDNMEAFLQRHVQQPSTAAASHGGWSRRLLVSTCLMQLSRKQRSHALCMCIQPSALLSCPVLTLHCLVLLCSPCFGVCAALAAERMHALRHLTTLLK